MWVIRSRMQNVQIIFDVIINQFDVDDIWTINDINV